MPSNSIVEEAVQILTPAHREVTCNEYGRTVVGGFSVVAGLGERARVSHATAQPDLLDPDRPSDDEMAAARHRMVDAYATTLEAAGWVVEKRAPHSRNPYLLAARR